MTLMRKPTIPAPAQEGIRTMTMMKMSNTTQAISPVEPKQAESIKSSGSVQLTSIKIDNPTMQESKQLVKLINPNLPDEKVLRILSVRL